MTKHSLLNILIASRLYIERTTPLLEPGSGFLTDYFPRQEDAKLMEAELARIIAILTPKTGPALAESEPEVN